jgi:pyruvate/2-oxoglutarate/acetoin dehydrogenase E1 component
MRTINFVQGINEAMREEMERDPRVFVMGEDVQMGLMGLTGGLAEQFGKERVRNTPLAECGFVGAAVGAAASGSRPIVDIMMWDFAYVAMDQFVNQAAKMTYMFGGQAKLPIVYRGLTGPLGAAAAQHSDSPHAMFMHVPGFKVVIPSTAADAKGLLKSAIRDDNPVLFFEYTALMGAESEVPEGEYLVPLGVADLKREGDQVTVVAIGLLVPQALAAAEELAGEGISVEVVDPRTLVPLDKEAIRASVQKTGRLVVADEAPPICGAAAEIIAVVTEDDGTFGSLKAPVRRVTRANVPVPYSPPMEGFVIPGKDKIAAAVREVMEW